MYDFIESIKGIPYGVFDKKGIAVLSLASAMVAILSLIFDVL